MTATALPQVARVAVAAAAAGDQDFGVVLFHPFDLAQAEAQGEVTGGRLQGAIPRLALTQGGSTVTPWSRASRTICAGA